jgi:epoxyqueuosine reductase
MTEPDLKTLISDKAHSLGFEAIGFVRPDSIKEAGPRLSEFLSLEHHGTMNWMNERVSWRADPSVLWPEARSIIMLAMNYGPESDPLEALEHDQRAAISVYAQNRDYHDLIKKRLKQIARWLHQDFDADVKVFVDTAPVMEKPLAEAAGLGWQGKHTNLVSNKLGSWFFLGSIFTTLDLEPDEREVDHCGSCQACLDICPTGAFPAPYQLDARRCISYLTIEHKGHIGREFRKAMGNRIYGCDDCLAVCPWNKFAVRTEEVAFHGRPELQGPLLRDLACLDDAAFRMLFSGSPVKRIGRDRFVRNVMIAIGNSSDADLRDVAEAGLSDVSPLVRAMAVWALAQLCDGGAYAELRSHHLGNESDETIRAEWLSE